MRSSAVRGNFTSGRRPLGSSSVLKVPIVIGKTPSPPGQAATADASDRQVGQGIDKVATKLGAMQGA